jgi:hypothetical protein
MIPVLLCCNDERGHHTGRLEGVVFGECRDWTRCVGNVFWDSVSMSIVDAKRLATLLRRRGWTVTERAAGSAFEERMS